MKELKLLPDTHTVQILGRTFQCGRHKDQVVRHNADSALSRICRKNPRPQPAGAISSSMHSPGARTPIHEGFGNLFSPTRVPPAATDARTKGPELTGIWTVPFDPQNDRFKTGVLRRLGGVVAEHDLLERSHESSRSRARSAHAFAGSSCRMRPSTAHASSRRCSSARHCALRQSPAM